MNAISSSTSGYQATGRAISQAQERFDQAAVNLVAETSKNAPQPSPTENDPAVPAEQGDSLVAKAADLLSERTANQVLYATFKAQDDQQKAMVSMVGGTKT
jgi:hypothetical protein